MASVIDFIPIFNETAATIRARYDADANAGLDPADPNFIDTTEGGFWWDVTQVTLLEQERMWDAMASEYVAALFPLYAWDYLLDEHGATLDLPRKAAVMASGTVTFTGAVGTPVSTGTVVATPQSTPDADPIEFVTLESGVIPGGGTLVLDAQASEAGEAGNVPTGAITELLSPIGGVTAITNAAAFTGGAEVEDDESYRGRILLEYAAPRGAGTVSDYTRWSLSFAPVGHATIEPIWSGPGTVRVIVTDQDNNPVSPSVVAALQLLLDPVPEQGRGLAPIGAIVTVATPVALPVDITATLTLLGGYSLDGTSGTIAVRGDVEEALREYVDALAPGEDVVYRHVLARFFAVDGVYDVPTLTLNGSGADVAVGALQIAQADDISLG